MLLFSLLENGLLKQDRGDVILFNNTSAEHPSTYRFVADCMKAARKYGIPFYQVEFQTYEDSRRGEWTRLPTYRMVNDKPKSVANPDGFHWRGEVFEELLSWAGYVPNQFNRICTRHLKLEATRNFLKDYLTSKRTTPRLGHYGNGSRMDEDSAYRRHLENQGGVPRNIFLKKREFVWDRPHYRPEQRFDTFYDGWVPFENLTIKGKTLGDKARFGKGGVEYVAFIGLRYDEQHRIQRVSDRNESTAGYEGEHVYMPLADMVVSQSDVNDFWKRQNWNLSLPNATSLSNCVFCFLKGAPILQSIRSSMERQSEIFEEFGPLADTPSDLSWWNRVESVYGRDLEAEGRNIRGSTKRIGFFGNKGITYEKLRGDFDPAQFTETMLPCDCTE